MKAFIIYVEGHLRSTEQAQRCLKSCIDLGYDAELFIGNTPNKMHGEFNHKEIKNSKAASFKLENNKTYLTKKACFSNHPRLWKKAIKINEPILVLEHDSIAIRPWDNPKFDEVLLCNTHSAYRRTIFNAHRPKSKDFYKKGIHALNDGLKYPKDRSDILKNSYMIPGTASYAITPSGAKRLLDALDNYGWEQSDYFINTKIVDIKYCAPDYFELDIANNLNLSRGFTK